MVWQEQIKFEVWCGLHKMQEGNWVSKCQMKDYPVLWRIHLSARPQDPKAGQLHLEEKENLSFIKSSCIQGLQAIMMQQRLHITTITCTGNLWPKCWQDPTFPFHNLPCSSVPTYTFKQPDTVFPAATLCVATLQLNSSLSHLGIYLYLCSIIICTHHIFVL